LPSKSKRKGNSFEREVVKEAESYGLPAKRAYASNGLSLGLAEDVDCLIGGYPIQCKRRAKLASWTKPPNSCFGTLLREDRGETVIVIRYSDFLSLLKESKDVRKC